METAVSLIQWRSLYCFRPAVKWQQTCRWVLVVCREGGEEISRPAEEGDCMQLWEEKGPSLRHTHTQWLNGQSRFASAALCPWCGERRKSPASLPRNSQHIASIGGISSLTRLEHRQMKCILPIRRCFYLVADRITTATWKTRKSHFHCIKAQLCHIATADGEANWVNINVSEWGVWIPPPLPTPSPLHPNASNVLGETLLGGNAIAVDGLVETVVFPLCALPKKWKWSQISCNWSDWEWQMLGTALERENAHLPSTFPRPTWPLNASITHPGIPSFFFTLPRFPPCDFQKHHRRRQLHCGSLFLNICRNLADSPTSNSISKMESTTGICLRYG